LRPLSNEEDVSTFVPKPVKENKRKRASLPEYPKPKKRTARKPNKNVIPLTVESVLRLRDEEEEEEDNESTLAVRTKRATDASMPAGSMMPYGAPSRTENIPERGSGRVPELSDVEDASHRNQPAGVTIEEPLEPLRAEGNAPSESLGAAAIEDSPTFPAFSAGVIREAQALGALDLGRPHDEEDPFRDLFTGIEDVAGAGDESDLFHGLRQALNQVSLLKIFLLVLPLCSSFVNFASCSFVGCGGPSRTMFSFPE